MSQLSNQVGGITDISRVLRCRRTGRYFTGEGWTESPVHAQPFPNDEEAMRACASHDLRDIDLVLYVPSEKKVLRATALSS
jgi:hypothetical protein